MTTANIPAERIVHSELLPGARNWSFIVRRGYALRIIDLKGGANVSALFYNASEKLERYNMADTLKAQHTAFLTAGKVLYSDMGRVLMSITDDGCGWHDTISGHSNAAQVKRHYGEHGYQEYRNAFYRNGRELFLIELGKWGLGKKDLVPNVNFFTRIAVDDAGRMHYVNNNSQAGDHVDLRAEMDTLVVLNSCPHPMDPAAEWSPKTVELVIYKADPVTDDDLCMNSCPENRRGFANTAIYHCQY